MLSTEKSSPNTEVSNRSSLSYFTGRGKLFSE